MRIYDLHLESGPKRKKTMVHVLELLRRAVVGPTTEEATDDPCDPALSLGRP